MRHTEGCRMAQQDTFNELLSRSHEGLLRRILEAHTEYNIVYAKIFDRSVAKRRRKRVKSVFYLYLYPQGFLENQEEGDIFSKRGNSPQHKKHPIAPR